MTTAKKVMVVGFDGADPVFTDKLIKEGKLPNFKKLQEMGVTTEMKGMIGALPTITPPCWATLGTGAWPGTHGITCFWNHTIGKNFDELDMGWNSQQCEAEFIWDAYAKAGKKTILFNYPTSFPPTSLENVIYIDGTASQPYNQNYPDYDKYVTASETITELTAKFHNPNDTGAGCVLTEDVEHKKFSVSDSETKERDFTDLFAVGAINAGGTVGDEAEWMSLVDRLDCPLKPAKGWVNAPEGTKEFAIPFSAGLTRRVALLVPENGKYTKVQLYANKKALEPLGEVSIGQEFSDWITDTALNAKGEEVAVAYKMRLYNLAEDGSSLNLYITKSCQLQCDPKYFVPSTIGQELLDNVGPIVAGSDIGRPNAEVGCDAWHEHYKWCADAINYLLDNKEWDLFYCHLHSIDCANHNMITDIVPESPRYERFYNILVQYYINADELLGKLMRQLDDGETAMFVVSDHAGVPRHYGYKWPLIGDAWGIVVDIMRDLGYIKTYEDEKGLTQIDWAHTRAVNQRTGYIYINLKGRDPYGIVEPEDYNDLCRQIQDDLYAYRDPATGKRIVEMVVARDGMEALGLYGDHVGDLYFVFAPDFCRDHGNSFSNLERYGFSMRCLFFAAGCGIKKNEIMKRRVRQVDIVPTVCELMDAPVPAQCEGGIIYQLME